jgi:hypothetical protein
MSSRAQLRAALKNLQTKDPKTFVKFEDGTIACTSPIEPEEVAFFLRYRRAFTLDEVLQELNINWAKFLIQTGYAVHTGAGIFMVTMKAARNYDLPTRHHEGWNLKLMDDVTAARIQAENRPLPKHLKGRHVLTEIKYAA